MECSRNEKGVGVGIGKRHHLKRSCRAGDRDRIREGPEARLSLLGFIPRAVGGVLTETGECHDQIFILEKITSPPGGSPDGGGAEVLLRSRLAVRVAWTKVKALETGEEMKRETDLRYIYKVELTGLHEGFVREGDELAGGRNQIAFFHL